MTLFTMWEFWLFITSFVTILAWGLWLVLSAPEHNEWSWTCICGSTLSWSGDVDPDTLLEPFLKAHKRCRP